MDFNSTINATWKCFSILFNERYYTEKQQAITRILFALLSFVLEMHVFIIRFEARIQPNIGLF